MDLAGATATAHDGRNAEVEKLAAFEQRLYEYMDNSHPNVLNAIRTTGKLEKETEDELKAAIGELKVEFTVAK